MIPGPDDPRWSRVIKSDTDLSSASLATKFLITRLRREAKGSGNLSALVVELRDFFEKNAFAQRDIPLL